MTELEELIEQKRAIEDKIKALKNDGTIIHNGIKLVKEKENKDHFDGVLGGWRIGIRLRNRYNTGSGGFLYVIAARTQEEAIEKLECLIADLNEFHDAVLKEGRKNQE